MHNNDTTWKAINPKKSVRYTNGKRVSSKEWVNGLRMLMILKSNIEKNANFEGVEWKSLWMSASSELAYDFRLKSSIAKSRTEEGMDVPDPLLAWVTKSLKRKVMSVVAEFEQWFTTEVEIDVHDTGKELCNRYPWNLIRPIKGHDAIQFGHVSDTHACAWTVAWLRVRIRVCKLCTAMRICNECVQFISCFHDLTFGSAIARNQRRISVGHLAFFSNAVGFWFSGGWIVPHVQQRYEAKHFICHG